MSKKKYLQSQYIPSTASPSPRHHIPRTSGVSVGEHSCKRMQTNFTTGINIVGTDDTLVFSLTKHNIKLEEPLLLNLKNVGSLHFAGGNIRVRDVKLKVKEAAYSGLVSSTVDLEVKRGYYKYQYL